LREKISGNKSLGLRYNTEKGEKKGSAKKTVFNTTKQRKKNGGGRGTHKDKKFFGGGPIRQIREEKKKVKGLKESKRQCGMDNPNEKGKRWNKGKKKMLVHRGH